jgi:hypothetical protein
MKKYFKIGFLILFGIFLLLQLWRPKKNKSEGVQANNITNVLAVDSTINQLLKSACFDCHSNNTNYPWYAEIMPVGQYLDNHIQHGKKELNFDEFKTYSIKKAAHKLEEVAETVERGEMPMSSYVRLHKEAKLSAEQKKIIINWANESRKKLLDTIPVQ